MLGAIIGDMIGSVHEFSGTKTMDFPLFDNASTFTDDTVLTLAVADCLMTGASYIDKFHEYTRAYPGRCYGVRFQHWVFTGSREPYDSWGNGSAMRAVPVGYAFSDLDEVLAEARRSAEVTHNHPEGIRGAQATAAAVFMARRGDSISDIRQSIETTLGYDLSCSIDEIRPGYEFNESCQRTVPEAISAFLESTGYEDAVRRAISLGGDADTLACIAGGIAEAHYGSVPPEIAERGVALLDDRLLEVLSRFAKKYGTPSM